MAHARPVVAGVGAVVAVFALGVTALDLWLAVASTVPASAVGTWLPLGVVARLAPVVVGLVIVTRRPGNRVGWALTVSGTVVLALHLCRLLAVAAVEGGGAAAQSGSVAHVLAGAPTLFFGAVYAWPVVVALLFPDGRLETRTARWAFAAILGCTMAMAAASLVAEPLTAAPYPGRANPFHVPQLAIPTQAIFWLAWLGLGAALVVTVIVIRRRLSAAAGERRLQLRWLMVAVVIPPVSLVACVLALLGLIPMALVDGAVGVAQLLVVGAVFVAVTKHGLYDIDRVVNRALVYATLTPVVVAVFAAASVTVGLVVGAGSVWGTALATAAAAAAVLPARARVQRLIDRRFAPRKVAAVRQIGDFSRRLHAGQATPAEAESLVAVVLDDPTARVHLRAAAGWRTVDDVPGEPVARPGRSLSPVRFTGAEVALVEHSAGLASDPELLRTVLVEVAPILAIARLQLDVRHRLREVEASRERIVQAGVLERRRLERDLHDGAQQRLVALGIALRRLQHALPVSAHQLRPSLDAAVADVTAAIQELRAIAAGVRPARLDEGLRPALDDLAQGCPVPVDVRIPDRRLPVEVEAAAYFIACEAVTNAVKHAAPTRVVVDGSVESGDLRLAVRDDGRGGAVARSDGGGLIGMADRARAAGGRLSVSSAAGAGTRVDLVLPCG